MVARSIHEALRRTVQVVADLVITQTPTSMGPPHPVAVEIAVSPRQEER